MGVGHPEGIGGRGTLNNNPLVLSSPELVAAIRGEAKGVEYPEGIGVKG